VSDGSDDVDALAKPRELLALHDTTTEMFGLLRLWFGIGSSVTLDVWGAVPPPPEHHDGGKPHEGKGKGKH